MNCATLCRKQSPAKFVERRAPRPSKPSATRPHSNRRKLKRRRLFPPPPLNLDINIDQRDRSRSHARNARSLSYRLRDNLPKLLLHFARQPADRTVVKPIRNPPLLGFLQPFNRTLLLVKISRILNLSLDRLKLVPDFRR